MYQTPTMQDFNRKLAELAHDYRQKAQIEANGFVSQAAANGMAKTTTAILLTAQSIDVLHRQALQRVAPMLHDFAERLQVSPKQIAIWARPPLENLANMLIGVIPDFGYGEVEQRAKSQCSLTFQQRLEGMLRDMEIGFSGDRTVVTEQDNSERRAFRLLQAIYKATTDTAHPVFAGDLANDSGLSVPEAEAAWRYLRDKQLIQTSSLDGAARVSAAGYDVVERANHAPGKPSAIACKRIIDGKTYNTETATELEGWTEDHQPHGPGSNGTYLFRNQLGAFFLYNFSETYDEDSFEDIVPLTDIQARDWLEKHRPYRTDIIESLFGEMPEANPTDAANRAATATGLAGPNSSGIGFDELLHPLIRNAAMRHYEAKDFRNAVLDAITAVFDKIRERTKLDLDGEHLVGQVFSLTKPYLILSEIETQSGKNDQSGFADIFRGFYRGVRNPKAHSLEHDLDSIKAGQHMVLASLLMRRIVEAKLVAHPSIKD